MTPIEEIKSRLDLVEIVSETDGPVDPIPWNQYVPDTKGLACDWSDPAKGGQYKI